MAKKEKELGFKVTINGEEKVLNSINDIEKEYKELQDTVNNSQLGSETFKQASKDLKNVEGALEQAKNKSQSFSSSLQGAPGIVGQVANSVKGLNVVFKALLANPIVLVITAIVAALTGLFKAFTSTKAGGELLERVMAGVGAAMDVLRDRVLKIGSAIAKFLTGDFKGAFNDAKDAVSGIGSEIADEFNKASQATKNLQRVKDETRALNVERAKQNALIADAKLKVNDENLSYAERKAALEEVRKSEIALAQQEEKLARERYNALKALADLSDSSAETLDELAQAEAAMFNAQQASKAKQKELFDQEKALRDREKAERKAAAEEAARNLEQYYDLKQKFLLEDIKDEEEKAIRQVEIEAEGQQKTINALKVSSAKKKELLELLEKNTEAAIQKIKDDAQKVRDEKAVEDLEKLRTNKLKEVDVLLQLEQMKQDELGIYDDNELARIEEFLRQKLEIELQNLELSENEKLLITEKYEQAITDTKKKNADAQAKIEEGKLKQQIEAAQTAAEVLSMVAQAAGEATALGKAAAIASTLINTYLSAQQIYTRVSETPGLGILAQPLAIAGAAAAVVSGLRNVKSIMSVQTPSPSGGGGGGQSPDRGVRNVDKLASGGLIKGRGGSRADTVPAYLSDGEAVINARSTKMFGGLLSAVNVMGGGRAFNAGGIASVSSETQNLIRGLNTGNSVQPVKAYVVSNDMTNEQELDRRIKTRSLI